MVLSGTIRQDNSAIVRLEKGERTRIKRDRGRGSYSNENEVVAESTHYDAVIQVRALF